MQRVHGAKFHLAQGVSQFSEMPFNSGISNGCSRKIANETFVCPILVSLTLVTWHDKLTREISENIMYLNALGQPMIVINSLNAASELLDRRTNIYSDRPRLIVAHEILCGGLVSAFMPYGDLLVFTLSSEVSGFTFLFLVGVACAARSMKRSQRP